MSIREAESIRLQIADIAHNGAGIGFIDSAGSSRGKAVFVQGALPGQIVECVLREDRKSFCNAELLDVISSPFTAAQCPHWGVCGGCPLQPMPFPEQLFWKRKLVVNALQRIGGFAPDSLDIDWAAGPGALGHRLRNKVELAFGADEAGQLALGMRKAVSHQVFQLSRCLLLPEEARDIAASCGSLCAQMRLDIPFLRFLTLRQETGRKPGEPVWTAILLTSRSSYREEQALLSIAEKMLAEHAGLAQVIHEERYRKDLLARGQKRRFILRRDKGRSCDLFMRLGARFFRIDPGSFFQVNSAGAESLAAAIREQDIPNGPLLDLYCGSGSPGQLLADHHEICLGIELDKPAILNARLNGADLPGWEYRQGSVEAVLGGKAKSRFSTALVDPPRSGMNPEALARLLALEPERLIYVSCNPATFARDARLMASHYQLRSTTLVDMFPDTAHVECCSVWEKG